MTARSTVAGAAAGKHAERAPGTGRFTKKPAGEAAQGEGAGGTPPATPPKKQAGSPTPPADPPRSIASRLLRGSLGDVIRGR